MTLLLTAMATGSSAAAAGALARGDARAIKARLFVELGEHAEDYWAALGALCTASIDRAEFHARVAPWLPPHCVQLHNALVLSMLTTAAWAPAAPAQGMYAPTSPIRTYDALGDVGAREPLVGGRGNHAAKRLRHMYAGLPQCERLRLKSLPRTNAASTHTAASVWAGAGAELLEKKRKEDEKRRAVEERRRTREIKTAVGAAHWRMSAVQTSVQMDTAHERLSATMQESLLRGVAAPSCAEAHELPDVHALQDRMTFTAVEAGLFGGVHVQAAAVVLSALQDHLRTFIRYTLRHARARTDHGTQGRITMPDMAAVLTIAPHTVVESLGQAPLERLLAPDYDTDAPASSIDGAGVSWAEDDAITRIAHACPTKKLAAHAASTALPTDADPVQLARIRLQMQRDAVRSRVVIDQLAPMHLLDRRALAEQLAAGDGAQSAVETPISAALAQHYQAGQHHHHANPGHRHKDEYFDVVDPVALLAEP